MIETAGNEQVNIAQKVLGSIKKICVISSFDLICLFLSNFSARYYVFFRFGFIFGPIENIGQCAKEVLLEGNLMQDF